MLQSSMLRGGFRHLMGAASAGSDPYRWLLTGSAAVLVRTAADGQAPPTWVPKVTRVRGGS